MARVARLRALVRSWQRRGEPPPTPAPAAAIKAGLGERPAAPADAGEAELDTLRGELVRELDRRAADDGGPAAFRRIAS
jgi:hypothetical protein